MLIQELIGASDTEIVGRVIAGEVALFELLIRRHNPALYKVGRAFRFTHHDVEDLMQEAQVAAYLHLHQFQGRSSYKTWLVQIMVNQCRQRLQKASFKKEIQADDVLQDYLGSMTDTNANHDTNRNVLNKELSRVLEQVIERLPADYGLVFTLRELSGLSVAEAAAAMAISEANVKVKLNRARTMLRKELAKFYSPEDIFEFNLIYCDRIVERVFQRILALNN